MMKRETAVRELVVGTVCDLSGADFSTHEDDIGDAEANCHQTEQGRDVRPDEVKALAEF